MAQNLIDLRRRIKAVKNTQKTTQAMKTVSAAKLKRSVGELNRTRPTMEKIESILKQVVKASSLEKIQGNPFLKEEENGSPVLVIISADRGLCGSFNSHLLAAAENTYNERIKEYGKENLTLVIIGNKAYKYFFKKGIIVNKYFPNVMSKLKYHHAEGISSFLKDLFLNPGKPVKQVEFVFTEYVSASKQEQTVRKLFPLKNQWKKKDSPEEDIEYIFEPSPEEIFDALLPKYVNLLVFQILLKSAASEHAARMVAMDLASRNASDMIRSLTLTMNKMRQASITKELLEIMTATEALRK